MIHETIKSFLESAIACTVDNISKYALHPDVDFSRTKILPADKLLSFLITQGASSTKNELLDFYSLDVKTPTNSAFNQQRAKLMPEALQSVFHQFNTSVHSIEDTTDYRFLAADGSSFTFFSKTKFASEEYLVSNGHSAKGFYSMHLNAVFDLDKHTYTDAIIQPVHQKDEFKAFCEIVDRHEVLPDTQNVYIGDRGYCSYNNMAHVLEKGQSFVFRTKDIHSKGLVSNFDFPEEDSFDIPITVTLVRSHSKKVAPIHGYKRYVDASISFDYLTHGSLDTYEMSFRVVRFPISETTYECIVTNLPISEFPAKRIKTLYFSRWGVESSFRKLKYTIGLSNFHAYKPEYVKQEIWAKLIAYNATEVLINHTVIENNTTTKHEYKVNFSMAVHICRIFLRLTTEKDSMDMMALLSRELIPIREERQYPRLQTAHFRKPRYFIYRAA